MVRIIAGKHRSRRLKTLQTMQTRPTLDQIKESFFNWIGPYFEDKTLLDGFSGSGSIGLEFISRYGEKAVMVEKHPQAVATILENVAALHETASTQVIRGDLLTALLTLNETFDFIYLDPPYRYKQSELLFERLKKVCHQNTRIFYEADISDIITHDIQFTCIAMKTYKRTKICEFSFNEVEKEA